MTQHNKLSFEAHVGNQKKICTAVTITNSKAGCLDLPQLLLGAEIAGKPATQMTGRAAKCRS